MPSPGTHTPSSRTDHLERVVLQLEARHDSRGVIRLMERWISSGSPPVEPRLAEVRAFLHLRLMDRAWLRLKELSELAPDHQEVEILTARMFIERGWPVRARRLLQQALEREPNRRELHDLLSLAHDAPLQPPANARDIERTGSIEEQLELAERFLCAGSQLRAKSILERVRRGGGREAARAEELLWGVNGDFGGGPRDPLQLARQLLPTEELNAPDAPVELEPVELEMDDVTSAGRRRPVVESDAESFPSLFRQLPEELKLHDFSDADITTITRMADVDELGRAESQEITDPDLAGGEDEDEGEGDTQVMMVIRQGGPSFQDQLEVERALRSDEDDEEGPTSNPQPETLNLRAIRSGAVQFDAPAGEVELDESELEFGDDLPFTRLHDADLDEDDGDYLEDEDEDLIVMTRKETPAEPSLPPAEVSEPSDPIEVVELNPPPRDPAAPEPPRPTTPVSRYLDDEPSSQKFRSPLQRLFPLIALVILVLIGGGFLMQQGASAVRSAAIYSEISETLSRASYRDLLAVESRLEIFVDDEDHLEAHLAGLALVKVLLWADYTGGPDRLQSAKELLARAGALGQGDDLTALARGWQAFHLGDPVAAAALVADLSQEDPEVLLLQARCAAGLGQADAARDAAARAVALAPGSPRFLLGQARVCMALSDVECARGALEAAQALRSGDPAIEVLALEFAAGTRRPREVIAPIEAFIAELDESVPPRIAGRAHFLHYRLLRATDELEAADRAMELAVAADPSNPTYLFHHAVDFLAAGRPSSALRNAQASVESQPAEWRYHDLLAWTLLAMDRVEELSAHLDAIDPEMKAQPHYTLLQAALQLEGYGRQDEALDLLDAPALAQDPVASWLRARVRGQGQREAAERLAQALDPLPRMLADRATAEALGDRSLDLQTFKAGLYDLSENTDPAVELALAAALEARGDKEGARLKFDRAVTLGEGIALAHYLRGQFYMDARDNMKTTADSWKQYLALDPSGPRADRARQFMKNR
jgi:hypothetical protein